MPQWKKKEKKEEEEDRCILLSQCLSGRNALKYIYD